jgi:tetratricopeptide (TPR) repeat protein
VNFSGHKPTFRRVRRGSNPYRILLWVALIVVFMAVLRSYDRGDVKPFFLPTPTPTRTINSFALEGEAHFTAGNLEKAIAAYLEATKLDPTNPDLWTELARIQTYSSVSLTTNADQKKRLADALTSINQAYQYAPTSSYVRAIRAFVLDWNANPVLSGDQSDKLLTQAEQEALAAIQIDQSNTLALAYYAEVLADQRKWLQAAQYIQQAMERDRQTNRSQMDTHRVQAYVYESLGEYNLAIQEYQAASQITPNLTFLYIRIGKIYRFLQLFDQALLIFEKAARINDQLGITDPTPYLAIANTYMQKGDFFPAILNVKKTLKLNPDNPGVYAQLGMAYQKSRNYEGAIEAFQCGLLGCDAALSCTVRQCDSAKDPQVAIVGMPLDSDTVVFYYTYGSILAGLHRAGQDDYCTQSMKILGQVKAGFSDQAFIMQIVKAGEDICVGQ